MGIREVGLYSISYIWTCIKKLVLILTTAPLSTKRVAISVGPYLAAIWRGVQPFYNYNNNILHNIS